jgi:hypothetical protein
MPKKYFFIFLLMGSFLFSPFFSLAQVSPGGNGQPETINCFDYYNFGSIDFVKTNVIAKESFSAGKKINFSFSIVNNNDYPVADGTVFVKIYRRNQDNIRFNFLADQFMALSDINLWPKEEKSVSFDWTPPKNAMSGDYFAELSFQVSKQFNLGGISFIPDLGGKKISFTLAGADKGFWFDDGNVVFNGQKIQITDWIPSNIKAGDSVSFSVLLMNTLQGGAATATLKLHPFDLVKGEESTIAKYTQVKNITLDGPSQLINFSLPNLDPGAYVAEIKAVGQDYQAISDIRFAVQGTKGRVIFSGLSQFPLDKKQNFYLFSCFSNSADFINSLNGKLNIILQDKKTGDILASADFNGNITPKVMAIKKDFISPRASKDLLLISSLYDDKNNLQDRVQTEYNYDNFTHEKEQNNIWLWGIFAALAVLLIIIAIIFIKRKNKK